MPFAAASGVEIVAASADEVRARLAWSPQRCTSAGVLHGGALMTLADSAGALCFFLNLREGPATATVESKTNFLRPVTAGHVDAVARPIHVGRTLIVVLTDVWDDRGRHVALTRQTQAV